jgi:hypothetical protein
MRSSVEERNALRISPLKSHESFSAHTENYHTNARRYVGCRL